MKRGEQEALTLAPTPPSKQPREPQSPPPPSTRHHPLLMCEWGCGQDTASGAQSGLGERVTRRQAASVPCVWSVQ